MNSLPFLIATVAIGLCTNAAAAAAFPVKDFGAAGDGIKKDTATIQKAIDACAKAGGGEVTFLPGIYLTGSLVLKSRFTQQMCF